MGRASFILATRAFFLPVPRPTETGSLGTAKSRAVNAVPISCYVRMLFAFFVSGKMAEKNELGKKPEKKTTNRGITWPDAATIALLNIWNEEEIRLSLENTKSSRETRAIYRTITVS